MKKRFLLLFLYFFFLSTLGFCDKEEEIKSALNQMEAELFSKSYIKNLRERIKEEREEAPAQETRFLLKQQGSLRNETAYRMADKREFTKIKNQLILAETGKLLDALRFKLSGRFYYDAVYDLTNNFGRSVRSDQRLEAELRDGYIDYSGGPWDIRLGRQQIVWGEAVGLFFADAVNAKDLREYILPDFEFIRIPDWALDLEYSKEDFHSEFIWLPIPEFNKIGVSGSEFESSLPVPSGTAFTTKDPIEPASRLENSQLGLRLSYIWNGWDWGFFYLYSWDKSPVYYRSITSGRYDFNPQYKRLHILGSTFSKTINDIVFKGEFVFNRKGAFSIFDANDIDGVVQRNFLDYLLGADYTFFDKLDANFQFMQRVVFNYSDLLINEKAVANSFAFRLKRSFLDGKLEPEFLTVTSLRRLDMMLRPKINYRINNNWRVRFGADIFLGELTGVFGRYDKKDRLYLETTYNF